jgi:hypothetical protein
MKHHYHSLRLQLLLSVSCNKHRQITDLEIVKSYDRTLSTDTIKKGKLFYPLSLQSVQYVHIVIFTLNEGAFINHFPKDSKTVCANNLQYSNHYVFIFITHPFHPPSSIQQSFGYFNIPVPIS